MKTLFAFVIGVVVGLILYRVFKVVTLEDSEPRDHRPNSPVLKLQNEIAPYVKRKDGKIKIKVVR